MLLVGTGTMRKLLLVVGREKEKICFAAFGWLKFLALSIKNPFLYFNNHIFI